MSLTYDHIIVGAGHNGLACAAYLAKSGANILILEAGAQPGGAAVTREILPGFHAPACAHLLYQLHPRVQSDLALTQHGLSLAAANLPTTILAANGAMLTMLGDRCTGVITPEDQKEWPLFWNRMKKIARHLRPMLLMAPPRLAGRDAAQNRDLLKLGWSIRSLGRDDMREFLRIAAMNVYDLAADHFSSPLLKARIAADAVLGTNLGPRSPGSVLTLLYRLTGEVAGVQGALALPQGGMGAVTAALATSAAARGAQLRLNTRVRRILVEANTATGVELEDGTILRAKNIISNAGPAATLIGMVGPRHLDAGFQRDVSKIRGKGTAAKLNLALAAAPIFPALGTTPPAARLLLADDIEQIERAFDPSKYGDWSAEPLIELLIPSLTDPTLAPPGQHVLSAIVQYAPMAAKGGWPARRADFLRDILRRLEAFAPGIGTLILAKDLKTPEDLQTEFGLPGGHWHHGELAIDQLLMLRPVAGAARYEMPIKHLFLCGAGAHPGGGVMGAAGYNAARAVLAQKKAA